MKDFVTFELAKKLKEKGYPQEKESTLAMYDKDGKFYSLCQTIGDLEYLFENFDENDYVCPTISQALRWLRKSKDLVVIVLPIDFSNGRYSAAIYSKGDRAKVDSLFGVFNGEWEGALLKGIEYSVDNILKKEE